MRLRLHVSSFWSFWPFSELLFYINFLLLVQSNNFYRIFGVPHDYNLDEVVKELVFFKGQSYYTLLVCGPDNPEPNQSCFAKNLTYYTSAVSVGCTKFCNHRFQNWSLCWLYYHSRKLYKLLDKKCMQWNF